MLSRRFRLALRQERGFFQKARRFSNKYFQCFYVCHEDSLEIAVLVSKKVALLATERNFLRRRVSTTLQQLIAPFSGCKLQVVLVLKKSVKSLTSEELDQELQYILSELCKKS